VYQKSLQEVEKYQSTIKGLSFFSK